MVTDRLPLPPAAAVTEGGMGCGPGARVVSAKGAPVPRAPSRLEVQVIREPRLPSSGSVAVAVRAIAAPGSKAEPAAGAVIVTVGVAFIVMVIEARPVLPPLSVAAAVMTCVPDESVLRVMLPPVPIAPSRLEVQATTGARLPSSGSLAVAVRGVAAPISRIEPLAGAGMAAVGGALTTTEIATLALLPPLSVAARMIAWVPQLVVL